jgi:hypothetical protein
MSSIETFVGQRPAGSAIKPYPMLDTNEDAVVAPDELVPPSDPSEAPNDTAYDRPTASAAATLTDPVAAALLDVVPAGDPAASKLDAVEAYRSDRATSEA